MRAKSVQQMKEDQKKNFRAKEQAVFKNIQKDFAFFEPGISTLDYN